MSICDVKDILNIFIGPFAIAAAGFWLAVAWKSRVPFADKHWEEIKKDIRQVAIGNGIAAACAAVSAILQTIVAYMPVCTRLG